jgi:DoxX-like protein
MVGLLFLEHGMSKYLSLPVSPSTGVAPMSLSGINGMIELVGGVLIVLGLFTRPVAFILAGDASKSGRCREFSQGGFHRCSASCQTSMRACPRQR